MELIPSRVYDVGQFCTFDLMKILMTNSIVISVLAILLLNGSVQLTEAQQPKRIPTIGFLTASSPDPQRRLIQAFKQGLLDLGYVEGQTIALEMRAAGGRYDILPALATELVDLKPDVIFAASAPAIGAAKKATGNIPIVFETLSDPVADGFVDTLARPGGNLTGLAGLAPELSGKRLELLSDIVPGLTRVGVLLNPKNPNARRLFKETENYAQAFAMQLEVFEVRRADELAKAFSTMIKTRVAGLSVVPDPTLFAARQQIADQAIKARLPAVYGISGMAEVGGLLVYGPSLPDLWRRAATYVDKILRGAKPADLPVEQPTKFELVINLRTAKQIGLSIPPNVLARADRVIK
jgi:putative tryptophan/tyrosine transport system substrate-binding protein